MAERWQVENKIANRYEIYRILGGGMGIVYVCYDHKGKITECYPRSDKSRCYWIVPKQPHP